ncbi:alpha/beta fold hydrolase [Limibacter armeniacum]|uniref:alpha/beta fold hydrolase n=1 Tax=Limibacter armeniacum TaxID=466084 RepID=UPI002FE56E46
MISRIHHILLLLLLTCSTAICQKTLNIQDGENIIHLEMYGKGAPMLIINGGPGMSSEGFRSLAKEFGETNLAIIYDQRGTGQSTMANANAETVKLDSMVKDIETIRQHLKIDKWVVFGQSFGGMLACYYATKHPENTKGLILSSSGGIDMGLFSGPSIISSRLSQVERDSMSYWSQQIENGDTTFHARLQRAKFLAPAYLYDKSHVPIIAERLTQANLQINGLVFQDMRNIDFDCSEELKAYTKPVIIIQGEQDVVSKSIGQKAHDVFPNSKFILLDKCGHYGWLDQHDLYFQYLHDFMAGLK